MNILNTIDDELDHTCSKDSNLQHLRHVFEGYRDWIVNKNEDNPYSTGSARAYSWNRGNEMAKSECK